MTQSTIQMRESIKCFREAIFENCGTDRTKKNLERICMKLGIYGLDNEAIKDKANELFSVVQPIEEVKEVKKMMKIKIVKKNIDVLPDTPDTTEILPVAKEEKESKEDKAKEIRRSPVAHSQPKPEISSVHRRVSEEDEFFTLADTKWRISSIDRMKYFRMRVSQWSDLNREANQYYTNYKIADDSNEMREWLDEVHDVEGIMKNLIRNLRLEFPYYTEVKEI